MDGLHPQERSPLPVNADPLHNAWTSQLEDNHANQIDVSGRAVLLRTAPGP